MAEAAHPPTRNTLRVSEVTRYIKELVENDDVLVSLSVRGEIAELSRPASGHLYFTLKDATSQMSCVLFRRESIRQGSEVNEMRRGASVVVHGFLTVYEPRGTYQMYVERVLVGGDGALFLRSEKLRSQLEGEGLFAVERKRRLPRFPSKIAIITSPGSQAYHDVLHRLRMQYPFVTVIIAGATVQGDGACDEMCMAIDIVNRLTDAETILLVRGGGAAEELAAFNEERLARAIFASRLPIVTGIGHETDHTIADFVADYRAATPSLAAASAVPDIAALVEQTAQLHRHLSHTVKQRLRSERSRLVDSSMSLVRSSPQNRVHTQRSRQNHLVGILSRGLLMHLRSKRARRDALRSQLHALDPLAILQRGYAVLTDPETGRIVSRSDQAANGQRLRVRVWDGEFGVKVEPA